MKPKYSIKNNFLYAIDGAKDIFKEQSFRVEVLFFILFTIILFFLPYPLWAKFFLFTSLFIPLLAEIFNTIIEKIVELIKEEYHILAKQAKDLAAFGTIVSIIITFFIWIGFIIYFWDKTN
jgi:diacylglycerol kinase (ATP)